MRRFAKSTFLFALAAAGYQPGEDWLRTPENRRTQNFEKELGYVILQRQVKFKFGDEKKDSTDHENLG